MAREIYGSIQKSTKYRMIFVFYEENDIFEFFFYISKFLIWRQWTFTRNTVLFNLLSSLSSNILDYGEYLV